MIDIRRLTGVIHPANAFQYAGINAAAAYFYPFLMVCSDLSISNATYITLIVGVVCQLMGLVYGFIMARYKQMKWIYVSGLAIALLGRGLQYEFVDPRTQMAGLVVSQLVAGIGFGVGIQGLTIAQGSANPKGTVGSSRDTGASQLTDVRLSYHYRHILHILECRCFCCRSHCWCRLDQ
ncbi:hypothetical protein C2W62_06725 [Candidatus Entotheonella serta]|nr:hypothetical protein C2W62_06725 [Candidatus Entotheonella serta]